MTAAPANHPVKAYDLVAGSKPRHMVAFQLRSGELLAFSYIYLSRVVLANSQLLCEFGPHVVKIEGKGLTELTERFLYHDVARVYEGGKSGSDIELIKISLIKRDDPSEPA